MCSQKRSSTGSRISVMLWRRTWIIWSSVHVPAAAVLGARHDPIPSHDTPPRVMAAPAHPASTPTVSEPLQTHPTDRWEHTRPPTPVMPAHTRLASRAAARSTAWMKTVGQLNVTLSSQPVNCNSKTHYISNNSINNKCCMIKWLHWSNLFVFFLRDWDAGWWSKNLWRSSWFRTQPGTMYPHYRGHAVSTKQRMLRYAYRLCYVMLIV